MDQARMFAFFTIYPLPRYLCEQAHFEVFHAYFPYVLLP